MNPAHQPRGGFAGAKEREDRRPVHQHLEYQRPMRKTQCFIAELWADFSLLTKAPQIASESSPVEQMNNPAYIVINGSYDDSPGEGWLKGEHPRSGKCDEELIEPGNTIVFDQCNYSDEMLIEANENGKS